MFEEISVMSNFHFQRIQNKIESLSASKFCGRDKVTVSGDEDNLIYLVLIGQRGNIHPDLHINAFLANGHLKVILCKVRGRYRARAQLFYGIVF